MRSFAKFLAHLALFCTIAVHNSSSAQISVVQLDAVLIESSDLMQAGNQEAALALLKRYEENFSSQPEFLNNLAVAYLGNSQPLEALTILRQLVDSDPIFSIVSHNLLELELQIAEGPPETLNPVLFVQSTQSFFETELADLSESIDPSADEPIILASQRTDEIAPESDNTNAIVVSPALLELTESWAQAWSSREVEAYLNYYAEDYQPDPNTSHDQWRGNRDAALTRSGEISVAVSEIDVQIEASIARVEFLQSYRSSNYSDSVRKTLVYSYADERWKIISETSIALE